MGAAGSAPQNEDKRKARLSHRPAFMSSIEEWRAAQCPAGLGIPPSTEAKAGIHVCIRKRPLFDRETEKGEYDCVSCPTGTQIVVHDGRMKPDMRSMFMKHVQHSFDRVFSEQEDSQAVYDGTARPLVEQAFVGGCATVFMFGQTGSGKTYTMSSIHQRAAEDIFAAGERSSSSPCTACPCKLPCTALRGLARSCAATWVPNRGWSAVDDELDSGGEEIQIALSFVELAGSNCRCAIPRCCQLPVASRPRHADEKGGGMHT